MEKSFFYSIDVEVTGAARFFAQVRSTDGLGVTESEGNAISAILTVWALSLKYVSAICSVDMATARHQTLDAVCKLLMVSAGDPTMPCAPLVIPIDEADAGCFSTTVHELTHDSITVRKSSNRPTTQEAHKERRPQLYFGETNGVWPRARLRPRLRERLCRPTLERACTRQGRQQWRRRTCRGQEREAPAGTTDAPSRRQREIPPRQHRAK